MLSRRELFRLAMAAFMSPAFTRAFSSDEPKPFIGEDVFKRLLGDSQKAGWDLLPIGRMIGEIGMALRGTPYIGSTLELYSDREVCSVNLTGLDCVTFYEVALCFARMVRLGGRTPDDLIREVRLVRYRGGKLDGYLSRLHYTSDWIYDNARKGVAEDITPNLPHALRMDKRFDYMSRHPGGYRQLKANPGLVPKMAAIEAEISARHPWYVASEHVAEIEPRLQTGDIVGIATSAEGLDCSHTGLVYIDEAGVRRFLNASSVQEQVVLGERLSDYAVKYRKNIGVMIARPL